MSVMTLPGYDEGRGPEIDGSPRSIIPLEILQVLGAPKNAPPPNLPGLFFFFLPPPPPLSLSLSLIARLGQVGAKARASTGQKGRQLASMPRRFGEDQQTAAVIMTTHTTLCPPISVRFIEPGKGLSIRQSR